MNSSSISPAALAELGQKVTGPVLTTQDDGYERETTAYDLATSIRPDVVVGAVDADDVTAAVAWAAAYQVPVGVQATGHGADRPMQGGLLIGTARLQGCTVDPDTCITRVGAGVRWRTVLESAVPHGPAGLNGSTTDVGVVGYTLGGGIFHPGADDREVLTAWSSWSAGLPETVSTSIGVLRLPEMDIVPEPLRNQFVVHLRYACTAGEEDSARLLAPMRAVSHPVMDTVGPMSYRDVDAIHMDPPVPLPYLDAGRLLDDMGEATIEALLAHAGPETDCPLLLVEVRLLGGALDRAPEGPADLVAGRQGAYLLNLAGLAVPPAAEQVPQAIAGLVEALEGHVSVRTLVNFQGALGGEPGSAHAWTDDGHARLVAAKADYDPENLLRFQHAVQVRTSA